MLLKFCHMDNTIKRSSLSDPTMLNAYIWTGFMSVVHWSYRIRDLKILSQNIDYLATDNSKMI